MRKAIGLAAVIALWTAPLAAEPVGEFSEQADVGEVSTPGSASFADGAYQLTASGANIWGGADAFHYVWAQRSGDLHITADIAFEGTGGDPHRKAGLMIRQNLTPGSPYADVMVHGNGMVALQYREVQDGPTRQIISAVVSPRRVRLEREENFIYFSLAGDDGVLHHAGGSFRIALQAPYLVGLALSAHDNAVTESARFSNVMLTVPQLTYVPDAGYTGRFVDNNNDHGLSPDGKLLVISDQTEPDNLSRIHVVTLDGSAPVRTLVDDSAARSYWHGWSPDGKTLAYVRVGAGDGSYDIWAEDLAGSEPRPLIVGPGVDDGPEYSPDGQYLYFNSTRSGAIALWRARADGSEPVQLTHDATRRDWFAHLSPDGKWVAYISFGDDVALEDHPPNREDVQLRLLPADGGAPPAVLTRLFGGQGTINVPSWSPDGTRIAFVSYRLKR